MSFNESFADGESEAEASKLRPAVVLAEAGRGDWILCQITSNPYQDSRAISITDADFEQGALRTASFARPGKLFTASSSLMIAEVGVLRRSVSTRITQAVIDLLSAGVK